VELRDIKLQEGKLLGKGSYGKVLEGVFEGVAVAVKVCELSDPQGRVSSEELLAFGLAEVEVQSSLQHDNICPVLAYAIKRDEATKRPTHLWVVQPLLRGGNLSDHLRRTPPLPLALPLALRLKLLHDICVAFVYMHETADVMHGDLKPANVLLNMPYSPGTCLTHNILRSPLSAQVCDFGTAQKRAQRVATVRAAPGAWLTSAARRRQQEVQFVGTPLYMDPESLMFQHCNRKASDVYSLAILAWEMLTLREPFEGVDDLEQEIAKGQRPSLELLAASLRAAPEVAAIFKDLLPKMWAKEQGARLGMKAVQARVLEALDVERRRTLRLTWPEVPLGGLGKFLGKGSFGSVYAITWQGIECALKIISIPGAGEVVRSEDQLAAEERASEVEAIVQSGLNHKNILPLLAYAMRRVPGMGQHKAEMAVIMPLCKKVAWERPERPVGGGGAGQAPPPTAATEHPLHLATTAKKLEFLLGLAQGLAYMHVGRDTTHGDLKPDNVLVMNGGVPVLSDFGLAQKKASIMNTRSGGHMGGSPAYSAFPILSLSLPPGPPTALLIFFFFFVPSLKNAPRTNTPPSPLFYWQWTPKWREKSTLFATAATFTHWASFPWSFSPESRRRMPFSLPRVPAPPGSPPSWTSLVTFPSPFATFLFAP